MNKPDAVRAALAELVAARDDFYKSPPPEGDFVARMLNAWDAARAALAEQPAEPERFTEEHVDTFVSQYNDVYCDQRKAGVSGGDAERKAMKEVLLLALGAYVPHPAPSVAVPEGWQLVPKVPTDVMLADYLAANAAYWRNVDTLPPTPGVWRNGTPKEATAAGYRAMLAASPQPPTQQEGS